MPCIDLSWHEEWNQRAVRLRECKNGLSVRIKSRLLYDQQDPFEIVWMATKMKSVDI